MAKTPAVLWYFNDWNGGTFTLSRFIKGCYMDLLTAQFNSGHLSLEEIKTVLGNDFAVWGTLSKKFAVDETGKYFNVRLDNEMYNSRKYKPKKIASASLAGLISSEKRLNYEQRESIKKAFKINDFIELEEELMKQTIKKWFNQMVNHLVNDLEDEKEYIEYKEEYKNREDENIFSENKNFLIPKMQQVWKNENPDYPDDKKKDFHALQNLAKFIFKQQGIKYDAYDDSLCAQILKIWQELVLDIAKHDFFKNYSLLQVDKHIQNIIQNLKNGKSANTIKNTKGISSVGRTIEFDKL